MDFDPSKDYYSVLRVSASATPDEVKRAFLALAKKLHPDTKRSLHDADVDEVFTALYQEVNEANAILSDPAQRRAYDAARSGAQGSRPQAPPPTQSSSSQHTTGTAHTTGAPTPPRPTPPQQRGEELVTDRDLPPVIRSDRGSLFVRLRQTDPYVGEDGTTFLVTPDGRIKPIHGGIMRSVNHFAVSGTTGEIAISYLGRQLLRFILFVLRSTWAVLAHYPLVLSMVVCHWNPLRRLSQERTVIGLLRLVSAMALSLFILASILVLLFQGEILLGIAALVLHLLAAPLLFLDLRRPYLRLLARSGYGRPVSDDRRILLARRAFVSLVFVVTFVLACWVLLIPLLETL